MRQRALSYGLTQKCSNLQVARCGCIKFHYSILYCLHSSHTAQMTHSTTSTEALHRPSVLVHILPRCGWLDCRLFCTVKSMHSALTPQSWNTLPLPAAAPVQTLHIHAGQSLWLQAQSGIVWLTCEGQLTDSFLHPGQSLHLSGPAKLHLGSQNSENASLRWCDALASSSKEAPSAIAVTTATAIA